MLIGNVGKAPDIRIANEQKVATLNVVTSEKYKDRNGEWHENSEWHNVVCWNNNAEVVDKYVKKGSQLYIEGKLTTRQWNDKDGNKRYTTEVIASSIQILGRKPSNGEQREDNNDSQSADYGSSF